MNSTNSICITSSVAHAETMLHGIKTTKIGANTSFIWSTALKWDNLNIERLHQNYKF